MDNRLVLEKAFWDLAAQDPQVDEKYICDLSTQRCVEAIGDLSGKTILDLGCGVGRVSSELNKTYEVHGTDISESMLGIAKQRDPKGEYRLCDGRTIPFHDKYFDSAYSMLVFQHLKADTIQGYFSELYRVLKHNGYLRFQFVEGIEDEPFSNKYTINDMEIWLKKAGFTVYAIERKLVHEQWCWMTAIKP